MSIWSILTYAERVAMDKKNQAVHVIRIITRGFAFFFTLHGLWSGTRPTCHHAQPDYESRNDQSRDSVPPEDLSDGGNSDSTGNIRNREYDISPSNSQNTQGLCKGNDISPSHFKNLRDASGGDDIGPSNPNDASDARSLGLGGVCGGDFKGPGVYHSVDYPDDCSLDYLGVERSPEEMV